MRRLVSALVLAAGLALAPTARASSGLHVDVLVPDRGNMQYASFWLALAGDLFAEEGYDVEPIIPPAPHELETGWNERHADFAVMPASVYPGVIAAHGDLVIIASLLVNDPTALVVRRAKALPDVTIGVAPDAIARFRVLADALHLDAPVVTIPGPDQNAAFHDGKVDALFAHSPVLERAIDDDDAVVAASPAAGDVPALTHHVIAALVTRGVVIDRQRPVAVGLVRALVRAAQMLHEAPAEATAILARAFPERDRRELDTIVRLYAPAIPIAPGFPVAELPKTAALYAEGPPPDLDRVDLTRFVRYDVMGAAAEKIPPGHARRVMLYAALIVAGAVLLGWVTKDRAKLLRSR